MVSPFFAYAGIFSFWDKIFDIYEDAEVAQELTAQNMPLPNNPYVSETKTGQGGADIVVIGNALWAPTGPLGSLADVEAEEHKSTSIALYVVHEGDTLSHIAEMFGVSVNTIRWANDIPGNIIKPGQVLVILPVSGVRYTVKKGDTLASIVKKYKGDAEEIITYNNITQTSLAEGQEIIIPNGEIALSPVSSGSIVRGGGPEYAGYYLRPIVGGRKTQGIHGYNGVDLANSCATPVLASAAGNVIISRSSGWNGGYGIYTVISHSNKTQTLYAHLKSLIVPSGAYVQQGQIIGYIGSTGLSTGCHLHFEIRGARNPF